MKAQLFKIGPLNINSYGLLIAIGVLLASFVAKKRANKLGLDGEKIDGLVAWCGIGGFLGAKLLYLLTQIPAIIKNPTIIFDFSDGYVVYGGIIVGVVAGYLYCRRNHLKFLSYFDLIMPSVALAQAFGRLGCFFAGCCYGVETNSFLGITFHDSLIAPNGVSLLPTQLISSGLNFIHFFLLIFLAKRKKFDGQVGYLYIVLYSVGRFILEYFRGDLIRGQVGVVSTSQFISILIFLFGVSMLVYHSIKNKKKDS